MSTAIPELIAVEIVSRLEEITTANGYFTNVASVDRITRNANEWRPRNLSIAVEQGDENPNEELSHEGNPPAIAYDVTFNIHAFVRESDTSTQPHNTTENAMVAAIKQAITTEQDAGQVWYTLDDNGINAMFGLISPYLSPDGDHAGATIPLIVTYRMSETDPFESRA